MFKPSYRQPRRDRLPHHARAAKRLGMRHHRRSIPRPTAPRCMCASATRRIRSARRPRPKAISSPSGSSTPPRSPRATAFIRATASSPRTPDFAEACAAGRHRVRRSAAIGDPRDGVEGSRQGADAEGRRAGRAGLSRRASRSANFLKQKAYETRLSGADQGGGRRRRQGHAPRRPSRRVRCRAGSGAARGEKSAFGDDARAGREIHRSACAISRCRFSPTATATPSISTSATARCSAAIRR